MIDFVRPQPPKQWQKPSFELGQDITKFTILKLAQHKIEGRVIQFSDSFDISGEKIAVPIISFLGTEKQLRKLEKEIQSTAIEAGFEPIATKITNEFEKTEARHDSMLSLEVDVSQFIDKPEKLHDMIENEIKIYQRRTFLKGALKSALALIISFDGIRRTIEVYYPLPDDNDDKKWTKIISPIQAIGGAAMGFTGFIDISNALEKNSEEVVESLGNDYRKFSDHNLYMLHRLHQDSKQPSTLGFH